VFWCEKYRMQFYITSYLWKSGNVSVWIFL